MNESIDNVPKEAIIGRLKAALDSGRYDITSSKSVPSRYGDDSVDFETIAKKPPSAIDFHHRKGIPSKSWYDPEISELHTPHPTDDFPRTYVRLKPDTGYHGMVQDEKKPGVIYRGMSHEEFENVKKTGQIKSHGQYNMEGQEGLTYYSHDPHQAQSYAHAFAPTHVKGSGAHKVYVVAVKDPGTDVRVKGVGDDEVGIPHPISAKDIIHYHEGRSFAAAPSKYSIVKGYGGFEEGSSSTDSSQVAWKKIPFHPYKNQLIEAAISILSSRAQV